jgi:hypothetical protein
MAARVHLTAAAIAIVVVAAACGQSAGTTATAHRTAASPSTTVVKRNPVPLVLETDAPTKPPTVALVVRSHAHDIAVRGVLYGDDYAASIDVRGKAAYGPTPWPNPTTIAGGDNPVIALDTPSVPDFVIVKSYVHVVGPVLNPEPLAVAMFGCNHFTSPKCVVERTASGLRILGLDQTFYAGTYLMIFCQWHLPSSQRSLGYRSDSVTASWLFRIQHTRATGP